MACIELPSDRKLRKRIEDGEYADCSHWAEGEERRWRFGDGRGVLQEGEEVVVGDIGPDFRWRRWLGKEGELRNELRKRGELNEADVRGTRATVTLDANVSDYSVSAFQDHRVWADEVAHTRCIMPSMSSKIRKGKDEMQKYKSRMSRRIL